MDIKDYEMACEFDDFVNHEAAARADERRKVLLEVAGMIEDHDWSGQGAAMALGEIVNFLRAKAGEE